MALTINTAPQAPANINSPAATAAADKSAAAFANLATVAPSDSNQIESDRTGSGNGGGAPAGKAPVSKRAGVGGTVPRNAAAVKPTVNSTVNLKVANFLSPIRAANGFNPAAPMNGYGMSTTAPLPGRSTPGTSRLGGTQKYVVPKTMNDFASSRTSLHMFHAIQKANLMTKLPGTVNSVTTTSPAGVTQLPASAPSWPSWLPRTGTTTPTVPTPPATVLTGPANVLARVKTATTGTLGTLGSSLASSTSLASGTIGRSVNSAFRGLSGLGGLFTPIRPVSSRAA